MSVHTGSLRCEKNATPPPKLPTCTEKAPGTYTAQMQFLTEINTENIYPAGEQSKYLEPGQGVHNGYGATHYSLYQAALWESRHVRKTNGRRNYLPPAHKVGCPVLGSICVINNLVIN